MFPGISMREFALRDDLFDPAEAEAVGRRLRELRDAEFIRLFFGVDPDSITDPVAELQAKDWGGVRRSLRKSIDAPSPE